MTTTISGDTGTDKATWASQINGFRLTLTSGTPVTTSDVTGATTIYCTPYKGESIALYDGSLWQVRQSAEFSLALGTLTSGKPYDVFCYDNAGTPTLEFLVWTNDTTRATALAYQDGVLCKSGALTRRYMGTFYTTSTTQTEDSAANRYLWNYYHRSRRRMHYADATASWTYSTATFRQANGSTANQNNFVIGVAEDAIPAIARSSGVTSGVTFRYTGTGVALDSTTTPSDSFYGSTTNSWPTGAPTFARYIFQPQLGRHYIAILEIGSGADTQTFYGSGVTSIECEVMA